MTDVPAPAPGVRTVLGPDKNPREAMRSIARFASENRGIAEIRTSAGLIGYVVLCKAVETEPVAIYDGETRAIEHMLLVDWLTARGYEASACKWQEINPSWGIRSYIEGDVRWMLVIGPPAVPKLPPEFPVRDGSAAEAELRAQELQAKISGAYKRLDRALLRDFALPIMQPETLETKKNAR
jgi:hypothetical protein